MSVATSRPEAPAPVDIRVLGRFSVRRGGEEVPPAAFSGRLSRQLTRVLLTRRGQLVPTDALVEALWPRRPPADPAANVKVLINRARRALGDPSLIVTGTGGYALADGDVCEVDAERFQQHVARGLDHLVAGRTPLALRDLRQALSAWGGEPLPEDAYADWAGPYRRTLLAARLEALEGAATAALQLHDPADAAALAAQAVAAEPLRERANLLLVRAHAASGDHAGAVTAYHTYRTRLADELGLDPSPEASALELRLLRSEPLGPPGGLPPRRVRVLASASHEPLAFVGRDRELRALIDTVAQDGGGVAVVSGRSGTGKSRLLEELELRSDLPVVRARAFPASRADPWSLARTVLAEAAGLDVSTVSAVPARAAGPLAEIVPELTEQLPPPTAPSTGQSRRALLLEAGVRLLAAAATPAALLMVDDLQWADASSLELLAAARARVPSLRLVVAYRPEEIDPADPVARFLADIARVSPAQTTLDLGPLDRGGIGALADDALAAVLCEQTDRTPLVVGEVLRRLAREDVVQRDRQGRWRPRDGHGVQAALQAAKEGQRSILLGRVSSLSGPRRELLEALALARREVPARVLRDVVGRVERVLLDDLHALAHLGLVRLGDHGWATAHDSVAETLSEQLGRERGGRVHALLATALMAHHADRAEVASHQAAGGDAEGAAGLLAEAARERLDRFADAEARALADQGLDLTSRDATASRLLEVRAEARARQGELTEGRADLRAALERERDRERRAQLLSRMAALSLGAEDFDRGAEQAELALVEVGGHEGAAAAARAAVLVVAAVADMNRGRTQRAQERYDEALVAFEHVGDARGVAEVLGARAMGTFMAGRVGQAAQEFRRAAQLLEDAGDLLGALTPRTTAGHALVFAGDPNAAQAEIESALALADSLGNPEGRGVALAHRSEARSELGEAEASLADATQALTILRTIGHRAWTSLALRALGLAHQSRGDLPAAEEAFREALDASTVPQLVGWNAAGLARLLIARGELSEAEVHVERALADGTPLAHHEARLAKVELAVARSDRHAPSLARAALELARADGHAATARRLEEFVQ